MIVLTLDVRPKDDAPHTLVFKMEALSESSSTVRTYEGELLAFTRTDRLASAEHIELAEDMQEVWDKHRKTRRVRLAEMFDARDGL